MSPDLIETLEESRAQLLAAASGMTEEQASTPPQEGHWSMVQCLEHVVFTEARFLGLLRNAARMEAPRSDQEHEAKLSAMVVDRSRKANAPELAQPKGSIRSLEQGLKEFGSARDFTIQFVRDNAEHLDWLQVKHMRFGELTGTQLVRIIAGHTSRHAEQMKEIRSKLRFA